MDHAILAPSSAGRWLKCTPSARLELNFPDTDSDASREGTLAHSIAEVLLKSGSHLLSIKDWKFFKEQEFYTQAMYEHVQGFYFYVNSFRDKKKNWLTVERKLDLSAFAPESFGTSDAGLIVSKVLHVFDLKFGKGVEVSVIDNSQLKLYALGALDNYCDGFDIEKVIMHIYQPRLNNISVFEMTVEELQDWGETYLKPRALLAFAGEGEFLAGTHCQFCKAAVKCRALSEYNLNIAKLRFEDYTILGDDELMSILQGKSIIESWLKKISEYTLAEALKGYIFDGYKLVEGRSNRKYSDEDAITKLLLNELHISNMHKPKELLNLEDMEKLIGNEAFVKYIVPNLIKPPGKPTLVPISDKREVFKDAAKAFNDDYDDNEDYLN